jgi:hypothetical protein
MLVNVSALISLLLLVFVLEAKGKCNHTGYNIWKEQPYANTALGGNPTFWRYQTGSQFVLKNGLALELLVADCTSQFTNLITFLAGRSGPVPIQNEYKAMCSDYCLGLDALSQNALDTTGCSCLELSTQPASSFYSEPGDWCKQNSARLLCDILGYCGVWNCRIDDYMCPRYEWNKKTIDLKGPGTCLRNAGDGSRSQFCGWLPVAIVVLLTVVFHAYY